MPFVTIAERVGLEEHQRAERALGQRLGDLPRAEAARVRVRQARPQVRHAADLAEAER